MRPIGIAAFVVTAWGLLLTAHGQTPRPLDVESGVGPAWRWDTPLPIEREVISDLLDAAPALNQVVQTNAEAREALLGYVFSVTRPAMRTPSLVNKPQTFRLSTAKAAAYIEMRTPSLTREQRNVLQRQAEKDAISARLSTKRIESPAWRHLDDSDVNAAIEAAEKDARRKLRERVKRLPVEHGKDIGTFVEQVRPTRAALVDAMTEVIFPEPPKFHQDEPIVDLVGVLSEQAVYQGLLSALRDTKDPAYAETMDALRRESEQAAGRFLSEVGSGVAPLQRPAENLGRAGLTGAQTPIAAGRQAKPDWPQTLRAAARVDIDADNPNTAQAQLIAHRQARTLAREGLLEKIRELPYRQGDLGQAMDGEPGLARRIGTAAEDAKVIHREIRDGKAVVAVQLRTNALWRILQESQQH